MKFNYKESAMVVIRNLKEQSISLSRFCEEPRYYVVNSLRIADNTLYTDEMTQEIISEIKFLYKEA